MSYDQGHNHHVGRCPTKSFGTESWKTSIGLVGCIEHLNLVTLTLLHASVKVLASQWVQKASRFQKTGPARLRYPNRAVTTIKTIAKSASPIKNFWLRYCMTTFSKYFRYYSRNFSSKAASSIASFSGSSRTYEESSSFAWVYLLSILLSFHCHCYHFLNPKNRIC